MSISGCCDADGLLKEQGPQLSLASGMEPWHT